jgi:hypothetical protein
MENPSEANYLKAEGVITNANADVELKREPRHRSRNEAKRYLVKKLAEKYSIQRKMNKTSARAAAAFVPSLASSARAAAAAAPAPPLPLNAPSTGTDSRSNTPSDFFARLAEGTSRRVAEEKKEIMKGIAATPVGRLVSTGPGGIAVPGRRNIHGAQQGIFGSRVVSSLAALNAENNQVKKLAKKFSEVKLRGGYRATRRDKKYLKRYKQGKSIGFTMRASLKAKGLIPRANGTRRVSKKYK